MLEVVTTPKAVENGIEPVFPLHDGNLAISLGLGSERSSIGKAGASEHLFVEELEFETFRCAV